MARVETAHETWCVKFEFEDAAVPLAKLIGHSVAAAVAFCAIAGICLIPLIVLKLLSFLGVSDLDLPLRVLAEILLFADITQFGVVFLSEVAVFAADTVATARRRIRDALNDVNRDRQA